MRRASLIPLMPALAVLALAGCGGGGSDSGSTASTPATAPATSTGGGTSSSGAVAVSMKNIAFSPATVTVKVGQKVTWTNEDSVQHNVISQSGEKISSPNFGQGATFSFTPTKAGTIAYVCTIHPGMNGKIIVTK